MKRLQLFLIALMLLPLGCTAGSGGNLSSSSSANSSASPSARTSATANVTSSPATTRVVALTPITADIIQRLDQTKLVGMSGSRLLAENAAMKDIPKVAEGRTQPNLEKLVTLKPDLVIGATGFHDQILSKLQSLQVPTIKTKLDSWRSLEDLTRTLATSLQTDPTPLLQRYQQMLPQPLPQPNPVQSTLVLVSRQPLQAPNRESWAGDLLSKFGAVNVVADLQGESPMKGYITLSAEKILQVNPDILILVDVEGSDVESFKTEPFWQDLKAVQNNRVYILDYYGFVNPGSIDAIAKACDALKKIYSK
jgi:iron complex transport system substrate-binding protein